MWCRLPHFQARSVIILYAFYPSRIIPLYFASTSVLGQSTSLCIALSWHHVVLAFSFSSHNSSLPSSTPSCNGTRIFTFIIPETEHCHFFLRYKLLSHSMLIIRFSILIIPWPLVQMTLIDMYRHWAHNSINGLHRLRVYGYTRVIQSERCQCLSLGILVFILSLDRADPVIRLSGPGKRRKCVHPISPNTPMASVVSLQQIPTLRELYQRSAIPAHHELVGEKFPFSSALLDRVSV